MVRPWPLFALLPLGGAVLPPRSSACPQFPPADAPTALTNDNRTPAGTLRDGVLTVRLVALTAMWYPEGPNGCAIPQYTFAEEGKSPQIPGPLLRFPAGTEVRVTIRNALPLPVAIWGLRDGRRSASEALTSDTIPADSTHTISFRASITGTYYYWANNVANPAPVPSAQIFGSTVGGLVIDDPKDATASANDRVMIMTRWRGNPGSEGQFARDMNWELTAFNGLSWPHTERIAATVGDTLTWRVIAANNDGHAMHLHGFYFLVESKGGRAIDTVYAPGDRRLMVTELMGPGQTMKMRWIPEREGNWIFHCHLMKHMGAHQRLDRFPRINAPTPSTGSEHASHAMHEMAGLVIGISVQARVATRPNEPRQWRTMHLFANQRERVFGEHAGYGFVLQDGVTPPATDSVRIPGSLLVLRRGEPTQIVVHNRLQRALSVHWHGIELESFSDGVAGWSGSIGSIAPPIAPGDSFVARMTPPRAGTFIYHVHNEAGEELPSGLYGALLVLEPGEPPDPARVFVISEPGPQPHTVGGKRPFVNGSTTPPAQELVTGRTYRFRVITISANTFYSVKMMDGTAEFPWKVVARDGADVPRAQMGKPGVGAGMGAGVTRDYEVTPTTPGTLTLSVDAFTQNGQLMQQPVLVTFRVRAP